MVGAAFNLGNFDHLYLPHESIITTISKLSPNSEIMEIMGAFVTLHQ